MKIYVGHIQGVLSVLFDNVLKKIHSEVQWIVIKKVLSK